MKLRLLAASLALSVALGCRSDDPLVPPDLSNNGGLMAHYVSMGNSLTAGFQSAGINDSTQKQSYAALFATKANAPFFLPLLNKPGCPPPFTNNVTQARVGGGTPTTCALRNSAQLPYVSNVAVPGALSVSLLDNTVGANQLTQFILGGRTQIKAMMDARPTFVSVWIGNNDVLGALTSSTNPGDPALVVPQPVFQAAYTQILDSITATGAKAALIGVADVSVIPYSTAGSVYWCLRTGLCPGVPAAPFPPAFSVNVNCAPRAAVPTSNGDSVLVPWTKGVPLIAAAAGGTPTTLDCANDAVVITPAEFTGLRDAVQGFNAFISQQAAQRSWAYVDITPALLALKANPLAITTFPNLPSAATGGNVTFGTMFSLDGVHPSAAAHRIVADSLISAVNRTYGTTIPFVGP